MENTNKMINIGAVGPSTLLNIQWKDHQCEIFTWKSCVHYSETWPLGIFISIYHIWYVSCNICIFFSQPWFHAGIGIWVKPWACGSDRFQNWRLRAQFNSSWFCWAVFSYLLSLKHFPTRIYWSIASIAAWGHLLFFYLHRTLLRN